MIIYLFIYLRTVTGKQVISNSNLHSLNIFYFFLSSKNIVITVKSRLYIKK